MGPPNRIGSEFYTQLAAGQRLKILPVADHGLLPEFAALRGAGFDQAQVCQQVRDFYEHTSCYELAVWSEAPVLPRFFLWGLTKFVSRRMDQLNFHDVLMPNRGGGASFTHKPLPREVMSRPSADSSP